jgi:hypothetical protein
MKIKRFNEFILNESKFNWNGLQDIIDTYEEQSNKIEISLKSYFFPNIPGNAMSKYTNNLNLDNKKKIHF